MWITAFKCRLVIPRFMLTSVVIQKLDVSVAHQYINKPGNTGLPVECRDNSCCWWNKYCSLFHQDDNWPVKSCSVHCPFPTFLVQDKYYFPFNSFRLCLSGGKKTPPELMSEFRYAFSLISWNTPMQMLLPHNFPLRDFLPLTGNNLETNCNFPAVCINFLIIIVTNCAQHQSLLVVLLYCWRFLWPHHYQHCAAVFWRAVADSLWLLSSKACLTQRLWHDQSHAGAGSSNTFAFEGSHRSHQEWRILLGGSSSAGTVHCVIQCGRFSRWAAMHKTFFVCLREERCVYLKCYGGYGNTVVCTFWMVCCCLLYFLDEQLNTNSVIKLDVGASRHLWPGVLLMFN